MAGITMIRWDELNGTEQFVVESTLQTIESEGITDVEDIRSVVLGWSDEYGWANDTIGLSEEVDCEKVVAYVIGRRLT